MPLLTLSESEYSKNFDCLRHRKSWVEDGSRELWWELYAKCGPKRKDGHLVTQKEANKRSRVNNPEKHLWSRAKYRAKQRNLDFDIDVEDVVIPDVCPILGIKIEVLTMDRTGKVPGSPALDRIDSSKGYIKGNVHVISDRANQLKSDGTAEELKAVADWMAENGT